MQEPDVRLDSSKAGLKRPDRVKVSVTVAARWDGSWVPMRTEEKRNRGERGTFVKRREEMVFRAKRKRSAVEEKLGCNR